MQNKAHKDCFLHHRSCESFCTFSSCQVKIICAKCVTEHLRIHPRNFIYNIENLSQIHGFDKMGKLKQQLGRQKMANEKKIGQIYQSLGVVLTPLINRLRQFESQSKGLAINEFLKYLARNKTLVETCKIIKSDPTKTSVEPELLIQETINQVILVNSRQEEMKQNTSVFTLYINSVEQMNKSVQTQIKAAITNVLTLLDNCIQIQTNLFKQNKEKAPEALYGEFFKNYINSHRVASKVQNNSLELTLLEYKRSIQKKVEELNFSREETKSLRTKNEQLCVLIQRLKTQLFQLKSEKDREQRERKQAISVARQKMEEHLIKNSFALTQARCISLERKSIDEKMLDVLLSFIKNPVQLILNRHQLNKDQLKSFISQPENQIFSLMGIKVFRMSFTPVDVDFLKPAFQFYKNLHTLQLNSCGMNDSSLEMIARFFPSTLKHLHLIDNQLMDQGLERMFMLTSINKIVFESLFLSYNNFSERAIDTIKICNPSIKTLHISKNIIKNKGVSSIGKFLHNLQELFIGGTGVTKDGIINICKTLSKLKRLSLVATEITTDVVSQILLSLHKLQWLDISYSSLTQNDLKMVEKLKIYNKKIEIVALI